MNSQQPYSMYIFLGILLLLVTVINVVASGYYFLNDELALWLVDRKVLGLLLLSSPVIQITGSVFLFKRIYPGLLTIVGLFTLTLELLVITSNSFGFFTIPGLLAGVSILVHTMFLEQVFTKRTIALSSQRSILIVSAIIVGIGLGYYVYFSNQPKQRILGAWEFETKNLDQSTVDIPIFSGNNITFLGDGRLKVKYTSLWDMFFKSNELYYQFLEDELIVLSLSPDFEGNQAFHHLGTVFGNLVDNSAVYETNDGRTLYRPNSNAVWGMAAQVAGSLIDHIVTEGHREEISKLVLRPVVIESQHIEIQYLVLVKDPDTGEEDLTPLGSIRYRRVE